MQEPEEVNEVLARASQAAELEGKLAATRRVAEEAMKLLDPDQLTALRHRLDCLESGDS